MDPIDGAKGLIRPVLALGLVRIELPVPSVRQGGRPRRPASARPPGPGAVRGLVPHCRWGVVRHPPYQRGGLRLSRLGARQRTPIVGVGAKDSNRTNGWVKWSVRNRPPKMD
jgi:hypothetical protein